ncbi:MAG: 6-hydroxymethylpterin diphosphokinase MptE-like protein [Planctomycetota bacterium]
MTSPDSKVSSIVRRLARRLQRMRFRRLFRKHLAELRRLRGAHASTRCFIIGNGPSLNKLDLPPLRREITFGTNAIFLNYDRMGFEPTYYCAYDPPLIEDRADEINALTGSTRLFPQDLVYCIKPAPGVVYVPFHYTAEEPEPRFSTDAGKVVYLDASVTLMCLQLAYHFGCDPVYLIGMDHNFTRPQKAEGAAVSQGADPDHFSSDYIGAGKRFNPYRPERVEESFRLARAAFEADGRRVFNATAGGKLEVFERRDYDDEIE